MTHNIAQNDQKSTRIILGRIGFFNGPLVLELWLIVDQVALIQSVAYAPWYTVLLCWKRTGKLMLTLPLLAMLQQLRNGSRYLVQFVSFMGNLMMIDILTCKFQSPWIQYEASLVVDAANSWEY
jgi:hypothetical protein